MALDQRSERDQLRQLEHLCAERDFARALVLAGQVLHDYPQSFPGRLQYARVLKELNRLEEAGRLLAELDIQFGGNLNVLVELGDLYFRQKRYLESRDVFQRVLFLDSFNRRAKATMAYIERLLENPADDKMEDTSVEMRVPRQALEPEPGSTPGSGQAEFPEVLLVPEEELPVSRPPRAAPAGEIQPISINLDDGRIDIARQPTTPEEDFEAAFAAMGSDPHRAPTLPEEELETMFSVSPPFAEEPEPPPPGPRLTDTRPIEQPVSEARPPAPAPEKTVGKPAGGSVPPPVESPAQGLNFDTASAADLFFQQGLYNEAEAIYVKLFQQTGRDEYEARIEEIARLRKTERALKIIEKLLAFQLALQKKGSQRV